MARRPSASQLAPKKSLNAAELQNGIARLQKRIEDLEAFDPQKMTEKRPPALEGLSSAIKATLARISLEMERLIFNDSYRPLIFNGLGRRSSWRAHQPRFRIT